MDRLLNYLVQQSGAESTEKLIQSYLDKYAEAGQQLTYNQALEEITADAWRRYSARRRVSGTLCASRQPRHG